MKIKQLEWEDRESSSLSKSPFHRYVADDNEWWMPGIGHPKFVGKGRDASKLACQADFERRVRECVDGESDLDAIRAFCDEVNRRAEANMLKTHKLEGSHYAAMKQLMKEMEDPK